MKNAHPTLILETVKQNMTVVYPLIIGSIYRSSLSVF